MAYTNPWVDTAPLGSTAANLIDDLFRSLVRVDIVQRLNTVLGTGASWAGLDPIVATQLSFGNTASPVILGGATDLHIRNNANSADSVVITDTGNVTISRGVLTVINTTSSWVEIRGASANKRSLYYSTNGSIRWEAYCDNNAESGSNNGSNWQLAGYNDAGTFLGNYISVFRSSGQIITSGVLTNQSSFNGRIYNIDDGTDTPQFQMTISGSGGLQIKPQVTATTKTLFILDSSSNTKIQLDMIAGNITTTGSGTFNGNSVIVSAVGNATTGLIEIRGDAGQNRNLTYRTGVNARWQWNCGNGAESGGNVGSDLGLNRYDDSGTFLDTAINIQRSTGRIILTATTANVVALTGITNGSAPSLLDIKGSASATPGTYVRFGGLYGDETAGAPSLFGIFADSIDLHIKSTSTSKLVVIENSVSIGTTGIANATGALNLNKDNAAAINAIISIQRQGATKFGIGLDASDNLIILPSGLASAIVTIGSGGNVTGNIFNGLTGFQVNGAAASGQFLRGNGTNGVFAAIGNGDLPNPLNPTSLQVNGGATVDRLLSGSVAFNPGTVAAGNAANTSLTVTGAQVGDYVIADNTILLDTNQLVYMYNVSAANTVSISLRNFTGVGQTGTNRTYKVGVIHF